MNPLNVDTMFLHAPELFAYQLPSKVERSQIKTGDLVKMFFHLEGFSFPRPVWFTVIENEQLETSGAQAILAKRNYGERARTAFAETVTFGIEHLYRIPLDRPEIENPMFDGRTRT